MRLWQPVGVMYGDGDWSESTRVVGGGPSGEARAGTATATRTLSGDVEHARRAVASFGGGGGPGVTEAVREFVRRYGWRAYALPILVVVTIAALLTTGGAPAPRAAADESAAGASQQQPGSGKDGGSTAPVAPATIQMKTDATGGAAVRHDVITKAALPAGPPYTEVGKGTFRVIPGTSHIVGSAGTLYRYDVEVEDGITGVDVGQFASLVQSTLSDPRSWSGHGVRVQRVDSGRVDFHVSLTSTMTVRKYCGYDIPVETSCYAAYGSTPAATVNRVVFNVARWVRGAAPYVGDLASYRIYMINHEDGHAMGHMHAHQCLPGGLAPVMMQQTFGLRSATTGKLCGANPWPYPPGVKGTPGAEQADTSQNNEYNLVD